MALSEVIMGEVVISFQPIRSQDAQSSRPIGTHQLKINSWTFFTLLDLHLHLQAAPILIVSPNGVNTCSNVMIFFLINQSPHHIGHTSQQSPGVKSLQYSPLELTTWSLALSSTLTLAPPTGLPAWAHCLARFTAESADRCSLRLFSIKDNGQTHSVSDDAPDHLIGFLQEGKHRLLISQPL